MGLCINEWGQVVSFDVAPANVSDLHFLPLAHALSGCSVLLADRGFALSRQPKKAKEHQKLGRVPPDNVLICGRGQWKARRLVETVLALFTQVLHIKRLTQRQEQGVRMRLCFAVAAFNLCASWHGTPSLHLAPFAL